MSIVAVQYMARKKVSSEDQRPPDGKVLQASLCRLGYCEQVVKATEVSRIVTEQGGKLSRQRVAQLLNAMKITDQSWETIANGLGVTVEELKRWEGCV